MEISWPVAVMTGQCACGMSPPDGASTCCMDILIPSGLLPSVLMERSWPVAAVLTRQYACGIFGPAGNVLISYMGTLLGFGLLLSVLMVRPWPVAVGT